VLRSLRWRRVLLFTADPRPPVPFPLAASASNPCHTNPFFLLIEFRSPFFICFFPLSSSFFFRGSSRPVVPQILLFFSIARSSSPAVGDLPLTRKVFPPSPPTLFLADPRSEVGSAIWLAFLAHEAFPLLLLFHLFPSSSRLFSSSSGVAPRNCTSPPGSY